MTNCQVKERLLLSLHVLASHFNYPASLHSSDSRHRPSLTPWPVIKVTFIHHSDEFWPCSSRNSLLSCFIIARLLSVCGWENTGCCRPGSRGQTGSLGESVQRGSLRAAYVHLAEHLTVATACQVWESSNAWSVFLRIRTEPVPLIIITAAARSRRARQSLFESFIVILDIF